MVPGTTRKAAVREASSTTLRTWRPPCRKSGCRRLPGRGCRAPGRKSSTAFFDPLVVIPPPPIFSATRSLPPSRSSMTLAMAAIQPIPGESLRGVPRGLDGALQGMGTWVRFYGLKLSGKLADPFTRLRHSAREATRAMRTKLAPGYHLRLPGESCRQNDDIIRRTVRGRNRCRNPASPTNRTGVGLGGVGTSGHPGVTAANFPRYWTAVVHDVGSSETHRGLPRRLGPKCAAQPWEGRWRRRSAASLATKLERMPGIVGA